MLIGTMLSEDLNVFRIQVSKMEVRGPQKTNLAFQH
jgi:hypothetical protein